MVKKIVVRLLKKYDVETIEKSLIHIFLQKHDLKSNNKFLNDYLTDFELIDQKDIDGIILKNDPDLSIETLERYFELLFTSKDKKLSGIFYTPAYIAEYIVNEVLNDDPDFKILDPSCGAGIFNYVSLKLIKEKFPEKSLVDIIENNIYGSDIEPISTNRSKIILILTAMLYGENPEEIKFNIITRDSLRKDIKWEDDFKEVFDKKGGFDAVVGNPPYVRIQNLEEENRSYLQKNWFSAKNGNIDIYFPFIELGLNLINENGKLSYINPNSYFHNAAGANLRKVLKHDKNIKKIVDFDYVKVFKDVNVYSCITIFTKTPNKDIRYCRMKEEVEKIDLSDSDFKTVSYNSLDNKKWVFLSEDEIKFINRIENIGVKLKDLAEINCGLATLADKVYLLNDYDVTVEDETFHIEPEACKPILKASRLHSEDEIPLNDLKIIWVYDDEGKIIPEEIFKEKYPNTYQYLSYMRPKLDQRDKGKSRLKVWYEYGRTQGLKTSFGEKLLTSTMNEKPNFVYCGDEDTTFISGYQIKTKKIDLRILQKILNSSIMNDYIQLVSKSYQGGWKSYAKSFIQNFGIPYLTDEQLAFLEKEDNPEKIDKFLEDIYFKKEGSVQQTLI